MTLFCSSPSWYLMMWYVFGMSDDVDDLMGDVYMMYYLYVYVEFTC
jgi:hypothetical protein